MNSLPSPSFESNALVSAVNGVLTTTTLIIAAGTKNEHASVLVLLRKHLSDFETFGRVRFEIAPFETNGGVQQREYAVLNERQATLLLSYMRNNEVIREFKIQLVRKFYEMAEALKAFAVPQTYLEALEALVVSEKARIALQQDNDLLNTILDNELGYASVIRAAKHCGVPESDFDWRVLKGATRAAGLPIKKAPCPRFKDKNLYPISIFEKCYLFHDFSGLKPGAVAEQSKKLLVGHVFTVAH